MEVRSDADVQIAHQIWL